jgi:hypothetical protein
MKKILLLIGMCVVFSGCETTSTRKLSNRRGSYTRFERSKKSVKPKITWKGNTMLIALCNIFDPRTYTYLTLPYEIEYDSSRYAKRDYRRVVFMREYGVISNDIIDKNKNVPLVTAYIKLRNDFKNYDADWTRYDIMGDFESRNKCEYIMNQCNSGMEEIIDKIKTYDSGYDGYEGTIQFNKGTTWSIPITTGNNLKPLPIGFKVVGFVYDSTNNTGFISASMNDAGFDARLEVIKHIGVICSSKNICHTAGKENLKSGGNYEVLSEILENNILTVNFRANY